MKEKIKRANEPKKISVKSCPKCKEKLVVSFDDEGTEVFVCENCKFDTR